MKLGNAGKTISWSKLNHKTKRNDKTIVLKLYELNVIHSKLLYLGTYLRIREGEHFLLSFSCIYKLIWMDRISYSFKIFLFFQEFNQIQTIDEKFSNDKLRS